MSLRRALNIYRGGSTPPASVLQPWYDSLSVKPSAGLWSDLRTLADGLNAIGKWIEIDFFSLIAGMETDEQRLRPLKSTSGLDITVVNSPTINVNGVTGNGSTSYLNLNWNPNSNGIKYILNDASLSCYISSLGINSRRPMGISGTVNSYLIRSATSQGNINGGGNATLNPYSLGLLGVLRNSSTNINLKINTTFSANSPQSSVSIPNASVFGCAVNSSGSPANLSSDTVRSFHIGSSLIISDDIFYNALNVFFTARGLTTF